MTPEASTTSGAVHGEVVDCGGTPVARFLGVPYAASPTGDLRFRAPRRPEPWAGVRPARSFGATPPAPGYHAPYDQILHQPTIEGPDWLTVNVWTPDPGGSGLPVLVWVHGGAFVNGSSAVPMYDGAAFARDGVVLVTLNYRLGVEGFAHLPDAPANRGLLDQLAALQWVQDNVSAFGGDPSRVTVFGESAGAMSIIDLLSAPRSRGLVQRAITQSGATQAAADPSDAALVTGELARLLGVAPTAAALADLPPDRLLSAQRQVTDALTAGPDPARFGRSVVASSMAFVPVVDGDLLPEHPLRALAGGAGAHVPLLTGTTTEEFRFFLLPSGAAAALTDEVLAAVCAARAVPPEALSTYRRNRPGLTAGEVLAAVITDQYFRLPALAVVAARAAAPTWVYEFGWRSPAFDLGAAHAVDVPFVFDGLGAAGAWGLLGENPPQALADQTHAAWVRFATDGDPGWPVYGPDRVVRLLDEDGARTVHAPREDERAAWG